RRHAQPLEHPRDRALSRAALIVRGGVRPFGCAPLRASVRDGRPRTARAYCRPAMRTFVYAHRGANRRAPENTLRAFALAIEEGADGVELDVRTCADGTVVVAHDPHLGRVGERAAWIAMLPWERVRAVRLGDGERVPLLDEAIDLVV